MGNNYCRKLNLGFEYTGKVLSNIMAKTKDSNVNAVFKHDPRRDVDPNFVKFLRQFNVIVSHYESFYTPPSRGISIHVDDYVFDSSCKINFVYGGQGSWMSWWNQKDPSQPINYKNTPIGTKYLHIEEDDANELYRDSINETGSIVNVGVFHRVINGPTPRYCLSHMLWDLDKKQKLQWDDAMIKFKDYLV